MYSFDGQHKTGLKVSLGGASKKIDKKSLLQSAKDERTKREFLRRQNISALKIQSWYRGITVRMCISAKERDVFDLLIKNEGCSDSLIVLIKKLCCFYKANIDYQRLIVVCQSVLKLNSSKQLQKLLLNDEVGWVLKLKKLLFICCRSLEIPDINIAIPLRMLEVFTGCQSYICFGQQKAERTSSSITLFLVQKGYFKYLRKLINARVPSDIEPSASPPTPFSGALCDLVLKATRINLLSNDDVVNESNTLKLYSALIEDLLSPPMTSQICYFLIPSLGKSFPINHLFLKAMASSSSSFSIWSLYAHLTFFEYQLGNLNSKDLSSIIGSIKLMIKYLCRKKDEILVKDDSDSDSSNDNDGMEISTSSSTINEQHCFNYVYERCMDIMNEKHVVSSFLYALEDRFLSGYVVDDLCYIAFHFLFKLHIQVHKSRFLNSLAFCKQFLRLCWSHLLRPITSITGKQTQLIFHLSVSSSTVHVKESLRLLTVFSSLFKYALFSIYDFDFYSTNVDACQSLMPFSLAEVVEMSTIVRDSILGLIMLMYPESKTVEAKFYSKCVFCCQMATAFIKHLYARDCRHQFCPEKHWLSDRAAISQENLNVSSFLEEQTTEEVSKPGLSLLNLRNLAVLKYIPFAVPFLQRVRIFQRILSEDKKESQNIFQNVLPSHSINITVNRKYLYQDAYDQLSQDRADDIKKVIRIHMINAQGLDEAGIDGGGVFREFMSQLLRSGFDPSIGFFKTTSQQLLYPNPDISLIYPDYLKHLHFLGRMLGKVIYESMMVELPLADFFLCKLLNKGGSDVDIHHLESLDPELYKNLLYLKNYKEDVEELSLSFTVANNEYGETKVLELKPGGKDISVTNSNKIEYIHLMADYRLNKQIRSHCNAFRSGLSDVINIEWLQMFDQRELQILISGAQVPIDIEDLRRNTSYSGSFTAEDPYIEEFWMILEGLSDHQKRLF